MDYDMTLYTAIRNNDIVMENLNEIMIDQEGRNKIGYIDIAVEAFSNPAKQANLLIQSLYQLALILLNPYHNSPIHCTHVQAKPCFPEIFAQGHK